MSIDLLKDRLPDHARDIKLNLSSLARSTELTEQQLWGTFLASAAATKNATVLREIAEEAADTALTTAAMRSAAWIWVLGTPRFFSSSSWLSRHMPQPFTAETAVHHSSKSVLSTPGLAMMFMRSLAGRVRYSWFRIRCSDR